MVSISSHNFQGKNCSTTVWLLGLGPLLIPFCISFAALILRVQSGRWDFYMLPDSYSHFGFPFIVILISLAATTFFWMMALYLPFRDLKMKTRMLQVFTHLLSWHVAMAYCRVDPLGYLDWWID